MRPEWVRELRDRCDAAGVAFFFKQWGGVQKYRTGRLLEGRTWDQMPRGAPALLSTAGGTTLPLSGV